MDNKGIGEKYIQNVKNYLDNKSYDEAFTHDIEMQMGGYVGELLVNDFRRVLIAGIGSTQTLEMIYDAAKKYIINCIRNKKIGDIVEWIESQYWSTHHPDECGYDDIPKMGMIINKDDDVILVQIYDTLNRGYHITGFSLSNMRWKI